ncbi:MAG: hypothetical protein ACODAG_12200 [Myxococcota bacterium]
MHALLVDILRPLVRRYGVEAVRCALEEARAEQRGQPPKKGSRRRPRPTAEDHEDAARYLRRHGVYPPGPGR